MSDAHCMLISDDKWSRAALLVLAEETHYLGIRASICRCNALFIHNCGSAAVQKFK
jgi:hypothetical protein